jgi:hypothetical protein
VVIYDTSRKVFVPGDRRKQVVPPGAPGWVMTPNLSPAYILLYHDGRNSKIPNVCFLEKVFYLLLLQENLPAHFRSTHHLRPIREVLIFKT